MKFWFKEENKGVWKKIQKIAFICLPKLWRIHFSHQLGTRGTRQLKLRNEIDNTTSVHFIKWQSSRRPFQRSAFLVYPRCSYYPSYSSFYLWSSLFLLLILLLIGHRKAFCKLFIFDCLPAFHLLSLSESLRCFSCSWFFDDFC